MKINNVNVSIKQGYYNKSKIETDGITHKIELDTQYPLYMLDIKKIYFDGNKEETVNEIINDLETVVNKLKEIRDREKEKIL